MQRKQPGLFHNIHLILKYHASSMCFSPSHEVSKSRPLQVKKYYFYPKFFTQSTMYVTAVLGFNEINIT